MDETITKEVLNRHLNAFGNNDLDEIMKDYTDQSVLMSANGPIVGLLQIRSFFATMFQLIPTGCSFAIKQLTVVETIAHIIWQSSSDAAEIPFGTDTFVMVDGKIKFHTVTAEVKIL